MKHAGSSEGMQSRADRIEAGPAALPGHPAAQSRTSLLVALALGLLLVAVVADAPVRALAQSLDPSLKTTLRYITGFGNSAKPLGIGLTLLGAVWFVRRQETEVDPAEVTALRSALILMVGAVALSGFLASLTKHVIGRIRPSTDPDAQVLEFAVMAFESGWAAFPSGHATTATAAAVALALSFPRQAWALLSLGLFSAVSRAFLGVHWFSDCLAGILLGGALTMAMHRRMVAAGHRTQVAPGALGRVISGAALALGRQIAGAVRSVRALSRSLRTSRR